MAKNVSLNVTADCFYVLIPGAKHARRQPDLAPSLSCSAAESGLLFAKCMPVDRKKKRKLLSRLRPAPRAGSVPLVILAGDWHLVLGQSRKRVFRPEPISTPRAVHSASGNLRPEPRRYRPAIVSACRHRPGTEPGS